jgi:V-type H+-transporting ATPase subunit E
MVQFIKQEAEEKANEIRVAAEEEFNIEKLQMVETEKQKIRKEYERKESQVEVKKKIEYSTELNTMRLKVLAAREEAIQGMLAEARATVGAVSGSPTYGGLLVNLIVQGVKKLETKQAVVRCRAADKDKVKQAMQEAMGKLPDDVSLRLDEHEFLPPAPVCTGGVHVISVDGKIVCNNSLDDRLKVAFERNTPEIRKTIFGANPNIQVKANATAASF